MSSHPLQVDSGASGGNWHEVEDLLDEIAQLSKSTLSAGELYRLLLERLVPTTGAAGGAVWTRAERAELRLEYQIDLPMGRSPRNEDLLERQRELVAEILHSGQPRAVPPQDGQSSPGCWSILHPFQAGRQTRGVIELVDRRALTTAQGRGYLQILAAAGELLEDYHRTGELCELRRRESMWRQCDQLAERVHRSLRLEETAYQIANEGRRVIDCDRVSVLVCVGRKCRALAISGVDVLDRRAMLVHRLQRLAARCVASGDPVWFCEGPSELPPEIEQPLNAYLDESHARAIGVVPLAEPQAPQGSRPARMIGALVVERFHAADCDEALRQRVAIVARHGATALANSLTHTRQPLAWLSRFLAGVRWLAAARQLPKTLGALLVAAAVVAALALIPANFDVEARGELQPAARRDVFATDDGTVIELLAGHAHAVREGDPLVVLRKGELDLEFRRVLGEIQTAEKKLAAVQAERLENAPGGADARRKVHQLAADEEEIKEQLKGLGQQREILDRQRQDLVVRSPMDGQALTWNLKQLLEARPVQRGQTLLTVADLDGPWIVELHLSDRRAGHVLAARDQLQPDLEVSFALASEPGTVYRGRIAELALATEMDEASEATVLVTVEFDRRDVAGLRPGATVIAQIQCGRRAVGYVWFHDLFEFIQSHWWW